MGDGDDAEARLARAVALAVREQVAAALDTDRRGPARATITIRSLFESFEKSRGSSRSWKENRNRLVPLIRRLGETAAADLTPLAWAEHRAARADERHRFGDFPKPHTLSVEFMRAKELLRFGVEAGFLGSNPLQNARRERTVSARETWLDETGVQQLLGGVTALRSDRARVVMRAFVVLCVDGMMRFNEARHLRRDRIRDGVVELSAKATKNKRNRFIGLTPRVLAALEDIPPVLGSPFFFANPKTRRPFGHATFHEWFSAIRFQSGVQALAADGERVVIHTLRHSGASAADARGASAMAIKDALGHSSLAITEKYLHRHREAGARDLARLMAEGSERERRGPKAAPRDEETTASTGGRTSPR